MPGYVLSCVQLCNPMDCSPSGSPVHGIPQARILEWVAISFSRGFFWIGWRENMNKVEVPFNPVVEPWQTDFVSADPVYMYTTWTFPHEFIIWHGTGKATEKRCKYVVSNVTGYCDILEEVTLTGQEV